jgi:hypothetical protein
MRQIGQVWDKQKKIMVKIPGKQIAFYSLRAGIWNIEWFDSWKDLQRNHLREMAQEYSDGRGEELQRFLDVAHSEKDLKERIAKMSQFSKKWQDFWMGRLADLWSEKSAPAQAVRRTFWRNFDGRQSDEEIPADLQSYFAEQFGDWWTSVGG